MTGRDLTAGVAVAALVGALALIAAAPVGAQDINARKNADPGSNAKVSRLVTRGSLQAAEADGDTLKRDDLSDVAVNTDCGPVQIGGTQSKTGADEEDDSLLRRGTSADEETTTVVRGSVVNICRR